MRLNNYSRTFLFLCSPPLSAVSLLPSLTFLHPSGFPFPVLLLHFCSHCLLLSFCPPHLIISSNLISSPSPVLILLSLPFRQSFPFVSFSSSPHIILFHFPFVHPLFHLSFSFISPSLSCIFSLFTSSYISFPLLFLFLSSPSSRHYASSFFSFSPLLIILSPPPVLLLFSLSCLYPFLPPVPIPSSFLLLFPLFIPLLPPLSSSFSSSSLAPLLLHPLPTPHHHAFLSPLFLFTLSSPLLSSSLK